MILAGIDPGLKGCICIMNTETNNIKFFDNYIVKNVKNKSEFDILMIKNFIINEKIDKVIIEQQQAFPGQGVISMFSIGKNYGIFLGILQTLNIPLVIVSSRKWMNTFTNGSKYTKEEGYLIASRLYPTIQPELKTKRGKVIDGRSDSLLMVEYLKKNETGENK